MGLKDSSTHQAFEIENINTRSNYIFEYIPNKMQEVLMRDSSRGMHNEILTVMPDDNTGSFESPFPFGCLTGYDYFRHMYNKALSDSTFVFLGWVDVINFSPIEDDLAQENI